MLEEIRTEARKQGLVMFPGMELSTGTGSDGVHLLLLGDPDADIDELANQWNSANATHGFTFPRNLSAGWHSISVKVGTWQASSSPMSVYCASASGPDVPTRSM